MAGGTGDISFRILEALLTAEDKQIMERSFEPVDPSTLVHKGIKDAWDIVDSAPVSKDRAKSEGKLNKLIPDSRPYLFSTVRCIKGAYP